MWSSLPQSLQVDAERSGRVSLQRTVIEQLTERGRRLRAPRLLAVQAVQVQIEEDGQAVERVHPSGRVACAKKTVITEQRSSRTKTSNTCGDQTAVLLPRSNDSASMPRQHRHWECVPEHAVQRGSGKGRGRGPSGRPFKSGRKVDVTK